MTFSTGSAAAMAAKRIKTRSWEVIDAKQLNCSKTERRGRGFAIMGNGCTELGDDFGDDKIRARGVRRNGAERGGRGAGAGKQLYILSDQ